MEASIKDQEPRGAGTEAACVFCHGVNSRPLYQTTSTAGDTFTLHECRDCRCRFLSPHPTKQQLEAAYDDSYYGHRESKFSGRIERVLDRFRSHRAGMVRRYVRAPANVLDIGCGNGRFLQELIDRGYTGHGIELPSRSGERAARIPGLQLKTSPLREDDFGVEFFDAVTLWHVLEHLPQPRETLQIIAKILKPGGYLMISLPNIDSLQSRLFRGRWLHLDPPRHLFFLGERDLARSLQSLGFEVVATRQFSLEQNPFGMQQSLLNCVLCKRDVLFEALKGNRSYAAEYSGASILLQKVFYVTTFPFFALLSAIEAGLGSGGTMELVFRKTRGRDSAMRSEQSC